SYQEVAYLLVIEGVPVMFTDCHEIVGTGGDSWIDSDDWTVALGLEADGSVVLAIDIESGMPRDTSRSFTLVDRDGYLIELMRDEEGTAVLERLSPLDDPAPATLLGYGQAN